MCILFKETVHNFQGVLASYEELLEARVRDLSIALNMSTALALAEFIEDEIIAPPMPLEVG